MEFPIGYKTESQQYTYEIVDRDGHYYDILRTSKSTGKQWMVLKDKWAVSALTKRDNHKIISC